MVKPNNCKNQSAGGKRKQRKNQSNKKSRKTRKNALRGGAAPSCLNQYTGAGAVSAGVCGSANIHNTNPQAMGDLDLNNKFKLYGGPVPLGENLVGGAGCGDEGVNTYGEKKQTFKQYLNNLSKSLDVSLQSGGGYIVDPSQYIAGQPVIGGYDDCCPPAFIGGKQISAGPDQRVCGLGAVQMGGKGKRNNKQRKHASRKVSYRNSKKRNNKANTQRGGDFVGIGRSRPAPFEDAFSGPASYFDDGVDLSKRKFEEVQPNYGVMAI